MRIAGITAQLLPYLADRGGNFGILTAIALPVLLALSGVAIDLSNEVLTKGELEEATDAAALATASALANGTVTTATAAALAQSLVGGQMSNYVSATDLAAIKAATTTSAVNTAAATGGQAYTVVVSSSYTVATNALTRVIGPASQRIAATSTSSSLTASKNALSMYLVLDRSGSMSWVTDVVQSTTTRCQNYTESNWNQYPNLASTKPCYVNKSAAVKQAAASLFDQLDAAEAKDPTDNLIRTGAVSFTDSTQTPQNLAWGTTASRAYVTALPAYPTGGTDMTGPMALAYAALTTTAEANAQSAAGNATFSKYIVLMTDGENTGASATWNPTLDSKTLATCSDARAAGITIYTVAFMAPTNGQAMLLSCAGNASNYYAANDMDDLVTAFKDIGTKASNQQTRLTN